jgi:hypothetical protein
MVVSIYMPIHHVNIDRLQTKTGSHHQTVFSLLESHAFANGVH